jgi:hypothetical protein
MATDRDEPPLILGGQGRSARDIRDSASWLTWIGLTCIVAAIIMEIVR